MNESSEWSLSPKTCWLLSLLFGIGFLVMTPIGVAVSRENAMKVNAIDLSAWWHLCACGPAVSVVVAILFQSTHPIWKNEWAFFVLTFLTLLSMIHIPFMYGLSGFE